MKSTGIIAIDCERMKYPHTGLYHYCYHLGKALIKKNYGNLCFYMPAGLQQSFGKSQCYIQQRAFHKFFFPDAPAIDVWHSTHQSTDYYPFKKKLKIVLTVHDLNYLYDTAKSEKKKSTYLERLEEKISRADHLVAISNFTLGELQKQFNLKGKQCSVIYNGCTIEEISNLSYPAYVPDKPFLFTLGTIIEKKNFHVLPSMLAKNDMLLLIAGITYSNEYKEKIITEAKKYGVQNRVIFTGPVFENDKQWYYKHCTAFLFPSLSEGFGLPVVEAMYFGKPVLISMNTSLPEIGGTAAYYFENFNAAEMQKTLIESLHHFEMNKRSDAVKERASLFNWNKSAEQYYAVYKSLMTRGI